MKALSKIMVLSFLILFQACCFTPLSGVFRTQNYILPESMKPRWITIEYENPKCPRLTDGIFSQDIVIPQSGFLCTSSSMYTGWHQAKYFLVNEQGERKPIKEELIWGQSSFNRAKEILPGGTERCHFVGEQFFYGSKDELTENNPIMEEESFLQYHPDCRD